MKKTGKEDIKLFNKKFKKIQEKGFIKSTNNRNLSVGVTFEKEIGKSWENFEIPDFGKLEIKVKCSNYENYISLFSATPDSYLFEIKRIHEKYGYSDKEFSNFKVFNSVFYGDRYTNIHNCYRAKLKIDKVKEKIYLNIYDYEMNLVDNQTSWTYDLLKEKLFRKLEYLVYVKAISKFLSNILYFKYIDANYYKLKNFDNFINCIENGSIRIAFRISVFKNEYRFGQIHDHGTTIQIDQYKLSNLFQKIDLDEI